MDLSKKAYDLFTEHFCKELEKVDFSGIISISALSSDKTFPSMKKENLSSPYVEKLFIDNKINIVV